MLTTVILTLNERERIRRCLTSLTFPTKVVIVDSFSKDGTLAEATAVWEDLGRPASDLCLVQSAWPGFCEARNRSLEWVRTPWVLWLDSDEWIEAPLAQELSHLYKLSANESVFRIPRQSFFLGRAIRHGGWYPDRKARLGRTGQIEWRQGPGGAEVHEDLHPKSGARESSPRSLLQGHLGHEPFRDRREQAETNERYSTLLAEGLARKLKAQGAAAPSVPKVWLRVVFKFFENYLFKAGFLDGRPGFLIALGSARSLAWRLAKTRRLMVE